MMGMIVFNLNTWVKNGIYTRSSSSYGNVWNHFKWKLTGHNPDIFAELLRLESSRDTGN